MGLRFGHLWDNYAGHTQQGRHWRTPPAINDYRRHTFITDQRGWPRLFVTFADIALWNSRCYNGRRRPFCADQPLTAGSGPSGLMFTNITA